MEGGGCSAGASPALRLYVFPLRVAKPSPTADRPYETHVPDYCGRGDPFPPSPGSPRTRSISPDLGFSFALNFEESEGGAPAEWDSRGEGRRFPASQLGTCASSASSRCWRGRHLSLLGRDNGESWRAECAVGISGAQLLVCSEGRPLPGPAPPGGERV